MTTTTFSDIKHPRVSDGTFTDKPQSAAEATLSVTPDDEIFRAVKRSNGEHRVESVQTEPVAISDGVFTTVRITVGGESHVNQRYGATLRLYSADDRAAAVEEASQLMGEKVSILSDRGNGATVYEGTLATLSGDTVLFVKGSTRKYRALSGLRVLAVKKGYGKQDALAADFNSKASIVPVTVPVTYDGIPEYDENDESDTSIAAVYLIEGPDFGNGREDGCMFMATDIQAEEGIVNGYFWSPDDAGLLTSESGSFYTKDLERKAGRLRDYEAGSLSYSDAWQNISEDRAEGYRQVLGK
jgi:hypothetical protein